MRSPGEHMHGFCFTDYHDTWDSVNHDVYVERHYCAFEDGRQNRWANGPIQPTYSLGGYRTLTLFETGQYKNTSVAFFPRDLWCRYYVALAVLRRYSGHIPFLLPSMRVAFLSSSHLICSRPDFPLFLYGRP
jgi:hypothetical protein